MLTGMRAFAKSKWAIVLLALLALALGVGVGISNPFAGVTGGGFVQAGNAPGGGAMMRIGFGPTLTLGEEASERPVAGAR